MYQSPQLPYSANTVYGYQGYQAYQQNFQASSGYVSGVVPSQPGGYGVSSNIPKIDFNAPIIHFGTNVNQVKPQASVITSAPVLMSRAAVSHDAPTLLQPPTIEQQIRTLFIGSIPDHLDDFWIDKMLKSVAKLKEWKRASNATGSPRNFGFAEYEDPEHVQRAIIALEDLIIPSPRGDGEGSKIMVVVDQKTREYLNEWNETRENKNLQRDRSLVIQAKTNLIKVLEDFKDPIKPFVPKETNGYDRDYEDELDDTKSCEEIEKERKNKKQKELEFAFQEREKRWLNREKSRTSALEREMNRDKEEASREARDREVMSRRLAEWDDDLEAERTIEEYYKDRSSWLRHRAAFRSREMEMDARDRALEERQEAEKLKANTNANCFPKKQITENKLTESGISKDTGIGPIRLTFSSTKKQMDVPKRVVSEVEKLLEDDNDHYIGNKKPVLLPLEYDDTETAEDEEARIRRIKDIVAFVPSEKEGLWSWPIKWDRLTDSVIEDKIQPFITKKIVEYVGVQEDDLIKFILDHLRKKGSAQELVKELEMAMDDEAELFVRKIYRYVIVISEAII
ncbi:hypothetical protein PCK2_000536 [Pneumocystis canis]|nr:hypothetical protein PCK2_000536 [Pneumocystis canis]